MLESPINGTKISATVFFVRQLIDSLGKVSSFLQTKRRSRHVLDQKKILWTPFS